MHVRYGQDYHIKCSTVQDPSRRARCLPTVAHMLTVMEQAGIAADSVVYVLTDIHSAAPSGVDSQYDLGKLGKVFDVRLITDVLGRESLARNDFDPIELSLFDQQVALVRAYD